ncbi:MAG: hypothetical protein KDD34_01265 [Bdellovibrionales bacterium]|nr:hypothetical protein [Bdellovibrionales bacterium]
MTPSILTKRMLLACTVPFLMMTACSEEKKVEPQTKVITTNAQMDSEELALAAEQIIGPYTFMLADRVLDQALEKDPTNKRAQLYKAFIKPFMKYKGIASRIENLVTEFGDIQQFKKDISNIPDSSFKEFITAKGQPITNEKEAQAVLTEIRNAFNDFRLFLKSNPDLEMDINLNPHMFEQFIKERYSDSCKVINDSNGNYDVECDTRMAARVGMNMADITVLQQYTAGVVLYLTPYTSYDFTGLKNLTKINSDREKRGLPPLTASDAQRELESNQDFGRIRKDESFSLLQSFGADVSSAWKWALTMQDSLCPNTQNWWEKKRPYMLVEDGICVENENGHLELLDKALSGATRLIVQTAKGEKVETDVDVFAISRNPIQNLKTVLPLSYNQCGKANDLRDKTLGGILPQGNAVEMTIDDNCSNQDMRR